VQGKTIIDIEKGNQLNSATEYAHYFAHAEQRSRMQTTVIQMVFFLGWLLSILFSAPNIKNRPWQEATLIASVIGSMLLTHRAPNFLWRLSGRILFELLIAHAITLMVSGSVYFTFWILSVCSVLMVGMAPLHHEPVSYSLCALLVCTTLLSPHASAIAVTGEQAWMFYLLIFSFAMGLILNTMYFLDRLRLFETNRRLVELAYKDGLTGLRNRRAFIREVEAMLQHATESKRYFFLIDIDNFKRINDLHGHGTGDEVLRGVAQRIVEIADPCIHGRLGGEEFGVVVQGSEAQATQLAAKIVSSFATRPTASHLVTVSIGIAEHHSAMTIGQWMNAADQALYEVKRQTKNGYKFLF